MQRYMIFRIFAPQYFKLREEDEENNYTFCSVDAAFAYFL